MTEIDKIKKVEALMRLLKSDNTQKILESLKDWNKSTIAELIVRTKLTKSTVYKIIKE